MANILVIHDDVLKVHRPAVTGDTVTAPAGSIPSTAISGGVSPTGVAGGDLAGTYPNPTVLKSTNQVLTTPTINGAVTLNALAKDSLITQLGAGVSASTGATTVNANAGASIPVAFVGDVSNSYYLAKPYKWVEVTIAGEVLLIPTYKKI